jgi:hypothetical protein
VATRLDLKAALIDKLGLLAIDEMIPDASLYRSINNGIRRMATEFDWPWLEDIASIAVAKDDNEYDLPARFVRAKVVSIDETELAAQSARNVLYAFNQTGDPVDFVITGNKIKLYPTPVRAGTLVMVYTKADNELADDDDTVLTPDWFLDVIVTYAAIDQAIRLRDTQMLQNLRAAAADWILSIRNDQIRTAKIPPIQTRDDF